MAGATKQSSKTCWLELMIGHQILILPTNMLFLINLFVLNLRPDVVITSKSTKRIIIGELTCPAEENIHDANIRKMNRYSDLVKELSNNGWSVFLLPFEVGARGFVAHSMSTFLRKLGFSHNKSSKTCKLLSKTSSRCSYSIWLARNNKFWPRTDPLILSTHKSSTDTWGWMNLISLIHYCNISCVSVCRMCFTGSLLL